MHNFKNLEIWKRSKSLAVAIYKTTKSIPQSEAYELILQIRKSALSIPSNIAEGTGRSTDKSLKYFLDVAIGSSFELETQVIIAFETKLINDDLFESLSSEVKQIQKMMIAFGKRLKQAQ